MDTPPSFPAVALKAAEPSAGRRGPRWMLFFVFSRRRGDFAEMMDVRCEDRGARSPELTSSQASRHEVPPLRLVFLMFFSFYLPENVCTSVRMSKTSSELWSSARGGIVRRGRGRRGYRCRRSRCLFRPHGCDSRSAANEAARGSRPPRVTTGAAG